MTNFNLSRKNKFILTASLLLLITLMGMFFWSNSMHQSVKVTDEPTISDGNSIVIDESAINTSSSSASKSKPLFASKSSNEKLKETSIMLLILFLIGIAIYAISSRDNFKKKLK
jgi:hypothetical protein